MAHQEEMLPCFTLLLCELNHLYTAQDYEIHSFIFENHGICRELLSVLVLLAASF
jgi:hypothetical protein